MPELLVSGWYCVNCGTRRDLGQFSTPCACGGQAMASDERFTVDRLASIETVCTTMHCYQRVWWNQDPSRPPFCEKHSR